MQVFISSGTHIDEVDRRVDAINQHLESPDVVFGEAGEATQTGQIREIAYLFPRAPLISLGAAFQVLLIYPVGGLILSMVSGGSKGRDKDIMQQIKNEHGAEIQEIDLLHPALPVYENPLRWAFFNWGSLVAVPLFASRYYPLFDALYISTLVLIVTTFVLFLMADFMLFIALRFCMLMALSMMGTLTMPMAIKQTIAGQTFVLAHGLKMLPTQKCKETTLAA